MKKRVFTVSVPPAAPPVPDAPHLHGESATKIPANNGKEQGMKYDVHWPLARSSAEPLVMHSRFANSGPKRIGFLWDYVFRGELMFPLLQAGLAEEFPGSEFVSYSEFGNIHGHDEAAVVAALPDRLREKKLDAVVVGIGA